MWAANLEGWFQTIPKLPREVAADDGAGGRGVLDAVERGAQPQPVDQGREPRGGFHRARRGQQLPQIMQQVGAQAVGIDPLKPGQFRHVGYLRPEGQPRDDHRAVELVVGEIAVDDGIEPLFGRAGCPQPVDHLLPQLLQQSSHGRLKEIVLAAEIVVNDTGRDSRFLADPGYRGVSITIPADRRYRGFDQLLSADRLHPDFRHAQVPHHLVYQMVRVSFFNWTFNRNKICLFGIMGMTSGSIVMRTSTPILTFATTARSLALALAVSAAALMAAFPGTAKAAEADSCKTVRFGDVGWSDIAATTGTASVILQ